MSFLDGIYRFQVDLSHLERSVYSRVNFQIPKYPEEDPSEIFARFAAYMFEYQEGLELDSEQRSGKVPCFVKFDFSGEKQQEVDVGLVSAERVKRLMRSSAAERSLYFYETEQIQRFVHHLKGSKQNWIENIQAFMIERPALLELSESLGMKNRLSVTVSEDRLYIELGDSSFELARESLSLWDEFQLLLEAENAA